MKTFKKLTLGITVFAFILSLGFSSVVAQDNGDADKNYKLTLKVVDAESGEPLTDAKVEILGIYEPHNTNEQGQFVMEDVNTDPHTFKIYSDGYSTWKKTLTVTEDESKLTVKMTPTS